MVAKRPASFQSHLIEGEFFICCRCWRCWRSPSLGCRESINDGRKMAEMFVKICQSEEIVAKRFMTVITISRTERNVLSRKWKDIEIKNSSVLSQGNLFRRIQQRYPSGRNIKASEVSLNNLGLCNKISFWYSFTISISFKTEIKKILNASPSITSCLFWHTKSLTHLEDDARRPFPTLSLW